MGSIHNSARSQSAEPLILIPADVPSVELLLLESPEVDAPGRSARGWLTCFDGVVAAATLWVIGLTVHGWRQYDIFRVSGFDIGIFNQGTWLLAHGQAPFVTLRGLNLLGDHASYILVLIAPLYRLWPDPRLLILVQAIFLAVPAIVAYLLAEKRISPFAGFAIALAYLAYPAMNFAAGWQFHPETIAAGFLAMAVLSADRKSFLGMAAFLGLAISCKEDVSFVVAGFGVILWLSGERKVGARVVAFSLAYFALMTFVVLPLINGGDSIYFPRNYGVSGSGLSALVSAAPIILWRAVKHLTSAEGLQYLALMFAPMMLLPFLGPRWLIAIIPPLVLNLGSTIPYQKEIEYQYLATSAPFITVAAIYGLESLKLAGRRTQPILVVMLVLAGALGLANGPWIDMKAQFSMVDPETQQARRVALAMVPAGASVTATYNMDVQLSGRKTIYEFPNPFRGANWSSDDLIEPWRADAVDYVVVDRTVLTADTQEVFDQLHSSPTWSPVYDSLGVIVLKRVGGPGVDRSQ